jgi:DnaJ homolog subfamily C member 19
MKFLIWAAAIAALYWLWKSSFSGSKAMTPATARRLLGVSDDADANAIIEAHRRIIAKVHPDAGGSAELAAQVNQARDILLKTLR